MSDYDELKKELHKVNRSISQKNQEIKTTEDELRTIEQEKSAAKGSSEKQRQTDFQEKYQAHVDSILNPINAQINNIKKEISDEEISFSSDFAQLSDEAFMARCTDTQDLIVQLHDMSKKLGDQLQELIGPRLYKNVSKNLTNAKMELGANDLQKAIAYFNECEIKTQAMLNKKDYVGDGLRFLESGLQTLEVGSVGSKGIAIVLAIVIAVIFFVLYRTVFPVYLVLIVVLGVFHMLRTYSVYEVLLIQKSIVDNIDSIEEQMREEALSAAEAARAELQSEHQVKSAALEKQLQQLQEKQTSALNAAKDSFTYDSALIQGALEGKLVNLEKREVDAMERRSSLQAELTEMMKQLKALKEQMQGLFSAQQTAFLNYEKAGSEFMLDPKFLVDIDDAKQKLVYFEFPCDSALFLYKEREDAINFIKLINIQIRSRLHPVAYEVTYYDDVNIGQDCFFFVPEVSDKNDPAKRLFTIVSSVDELLERVEQYTTEMKTRQQSFGHDKSIIEYNQRMLDLGSITMPYLFAFIMDPDESLIQKLGVVTRAASMYGIYISVFVEEAKFASFGANVKRTLELFSTFYIIQNGKINPRARDFLLTTYNPEK